MNVNILSHKILLGFLLPRSKSCFNTTLTPAKIKAQLLRTFNDS